MQESKFTDKSKSNAENLEIICKNFSHQCHQCNYEESQLYDISKKCLSQLLGHLSNVTYRDEIADFFVNQIQGESKFIEDKYEEIKQMFTNLVAYNKYQLFRSSADTYVNSLVEYITLAKKPICKEEMVCKLMETSNNFLKSVIREIKFNYESVVESYVFAFAKAHCNLKDEDVHSSHFYLFYQDFSHILRNWQSSLQNLATDKKKIRDISEHYLNQLFDLFIGKEFAYHFSTLSKDGSRDQELEKIFSKYISFIKEQIVQISASVYSRILTNFIVANYPLSESELDDKLVELSNKFLYSTKAKHNYRVNITILLIKCNLLEDKYRLSNTYANFPHEKFLIYRT